MAWPYSIRTTYASDGSGPSVKGDDLMALQQLGNFIATALNIFGDGSAGAINLTGATQVALTDHVWADTVTMADVTGYNTNGFGIFCRTKFSTVGTSGPSIDGSGGDATTSTPGYGVGLTSRTQCGPFMNVGYGPGNGEYSSVQGGTRFGFGGAGGASGSTFPGTSIIDPGALVKRYPFWAGPTRQGMGPKFYPGTVSASTWPASLGLIAPGITWDCFIGGGCGGMGLGATGGGQVGGAPGAGGSLVVIAAPTIELAAGTTLYSNGGAGGAGSGASGSASGGGGGGGGAFLFICNTFIDHGATYLAAAGAGGAGYGGGTAGAAGTAGNTTPKIILLPDFNP